MLEYLNDLQEHFFTWCDNALQNHIDCEGTVFMQWRPRKNPDGSYDLVLITAARDEVASIFSVPVPKEFHDLLEHEYFCNHPPDEEKGN